MIFGGKCMKGRPTTMTLNQLIDKLVSISRSRSGDTELYIDNTKKVRGVELGVGNNGNSYCNIITEVK